MEKFELIKFDDFLDELLGHPGTKERDEFEQEVINDILKEKIRIERKKRNLSYKALSKQTGIKESIIRKIEESTTEVKFGYVFKVLNALNIKI